jgi:hypothetical protein
VFAYVLLFEAAKILIIWKNSKLGKIRVLLQLIAEFLVFLRPF